MEKEIREKEIREKRIIDYITKNDEINIKLSCVFYPHVYKNVIRVDYSLEENIFK